MDSAKGVVTINLQDLRYFCSVADHGSFTKAALSLHITQPTISRQLIQLENEIGVKLIERSSRNLVLTPAGVLFRERCQSLLEILDNSVKEVSSLSNDICGRLSFGSIITLGSYFLSDLINEYHTLYPKVTYELWHGTSFEILEQLNNRIIEVGFVSAPFNTSCFDGLPLFTSNLGVFMPRDQQIGANETQISWEEIKNTPLIVPQRYSRTVEHIFKENNLGSPNVICDSNSFNLGLLLADSGIGYAISPTLGKRAYANTSLMHKILIEPKNTIEYYIIWRKNDALSAPAKKLIDLTTKWSKQYIIK